MAIKKYHVSKNLFDKNATDTNNGYVGNGYLTSDGTINTNNGYRISEYIPILSNKKYITYAAGLSAPSVCFYDANKNYISGVNYAGRLNATFTTPSDAKYLRLSFRAVDGAIMFLNLGDTALPYEPYGNTWIEIPYRIFNTSQDTITSLPVDIYTDGQPIGANLLSINDLSGTTWATQYPAMLTALNTLPKGTYTLSIVFKLTQRNDASDNSVYGVYCSKGATVLFNERVLWGNKTVNDEVTWTCTFTIDDTLAGVLNTLYIYGCGINGTGTTGKANISNIMINSGSSALPYQPYAPIIIKGNMSQSGTPSPSTPITPSECGERTGNLFSGFDIVGQVPSVSNGELVNSVSGGTTNLIALSDSLISVTVFSAMNVYLFLYDENETFIGYTSRATTGTIHSSAITGYTNAIYARIRVDNVSQYDNNITLVYGSTAPSSYIPYGFKLDIKSGNTTTPVYLGNVQSTRWIKKLVLTGEENWLTSNSRFYLDTITPDYLRGANNILAICSHYSSYPQVSTAMNVPDGSISFSYATAQRLYCYDTSITNVTDFKTYLAQQYSAGTPVTVWYVLADETTGIVNEPIRKIGDYADSVSVTGIPTTSGGIEFDVDTVLKPSEVDLTYHGWHPKTPKRKSANLFDVSTLQNGYYGTVATSSGYLYNADDKYRCFSMTLSAGTYTIFAKSSSLIIRLLRVSSLSLGANAVNKDNQAYTFTLSTEETIYVSLRNSTTTNDFTGLTIMLNSGSSDLPYAPYWE